MFRGDTTVNILGKVSNQLRCVPSVVPLYVIEPLGRARNNGTKIGIDEYFCRSARLSPMDKLQGEVVGAMECGFYNLETDGWQASRDLLTPEIRVYSPKGHSQRTHGEATSIFFDLARPPRSQTNTASDLKNVDLTRKNNNNTANTDKIIDQSLDNGEDKKAEAGVPPQSERLRQEKTVTIAEALYTAVETLSKQSIQVDVVFSTKAYQITM